MPLATVTKNGRSHSLLGSQRLRQLRFWPCLAILMVLIAYIASVTPGHVFISDDFAAYVMHAENLADGHPYSDIHYVPNPATVGFAPARGYPPVYPLILAPVYKIWGLNLRAMKVMTVLCFGVTLLALALIFEDTLPQWAICALILVVGFNINFWEQHNYLLSEFAYLMFSMVLLLALQKIYARLDPRAWSVGAAVLVSLLLYAAYGTRTIGIVLLPALVLTDVWKFRRPSRFLILSAVITLSLIVLQNSLLVSPKAYMNAQHISPAAFREHISYYGKTLSYAWDNGNSKAIQIIFALFFTGLATVRFHRRFWSRKSALEIYLLGYVLVLIAWTTEIGMRGLLPILPLYFAFGLEEFLNLTRLIPRAAIRVACSTVLGIFIGISYLSVFRSPARHDHPLDVRDPSAQELFAYLRANTSPADLLVFQKARTLALFTDRQTTMLAPGEPPADSKKFLAETNARLLIQNSSMGFPIPEFIESKLIAPVPIFQNSAFQVYVINHQR